MNYLAHFHLAGDHPAMLQGALLGDFVKGPLRGQFGDAVERGISLHRKIDAFSNGAEDVRRASQALTPDLQRYAGIVTDVVFDYFLSHHWSRFHSQQLRGFAQSVYRAIAPAIDSWPIPAQRFSKRMVEHDLLCQYGEWATVDRVLGSIGMRLSHENPLSRAADTVRPKLKQLELDFFEFYPKLQTYTRGLTKDCARPEGVGGTSHGRVISSCPGGDE